MPRREICLHRVKGTGIYNIKYLARNLKEMHSIMAVGQEGLVARIGGIAGNEREQEMGLHVKKLRPTPEPTSSSETPPLKGTTTFPNSATGWEPSV